MKKPKYRCKSRVFVAAFVALLAAACGEGETNMAGTDGDRLPQPDVGDVDVATTDVASCGDEMVTTPDGCRPCLSATATGDFLDNDCDGVVDETCPGECEYDRSCTSGWPDCAPALGMPDLDDCPLDLATLLSAEERRRPARDSGGWSPPTPTIVADVSDMIAALASGQVRPAQGYLMCSLADSVVMVPEVASGRPLVAVRTSAGTVPLVVEAPHPVFEVGTLDQALQMFQVIRARALVVAGTHRCANTAELACDGQTSVCGASGPFRESDSAHNPGGVFQAAHLALTNAFPTSWVISLHGMSGDGLSLSNGVRGAGDLPAMSPVRRLTEALSAALPDELVTSCQGWPGAAPTARLCGTTNVQGRALNGSPDTCHEAAGAPSYRFVHLEQSRALRDDPTPIITTIAELE